MDIPRINKNVHTTLARCEDEDTDTVMNCTLECMRGLAECLEGSVEKGVIYGKGVYGKGEINDHPAMQQAYEMGKTIS